MKKLIFCLLIFLTALQVDAQMINGRYYNPLGNYNQHRGLTVDSNMNLPRVIPQYGFRKGAVMADTTKGVLRVFNGTDWVWQIGISDILIVNGGGTDPDTLKQVFLGDTTVVGTFTGSGGSSAWADITGKPTTLAGYGITDPIVLTSSSYSDPAWITSLAWSKITGAPAFITNIPTDSSVAINNKINLKLNISDTPSMLDPYLRKIDTTDKWIGAGWLASLMKYADTSGMLSPYLRKTDTAAMLAPYLRSSDAIKWHLINGANNLGSGAQVFKDTSSNKINIRSITATGGMQATQNTNDVEISLPSQTSNSGKYLKTNGTNATWEDAGSNLDSTAAKLRAGTVAQRLAIASPDTGQVFYQNDELEGTYTYNGSIWQYIPPANSIINEFDKFTPISMNFSGGSSGAGAAQSQQYGLSTDKLAYGTLIQTTGSTSSGSGYQTYPGTRDSGYKRSFISYTVLNFTQLSNATDEFRIIVGPADVIFNASTGDGSAVFVYRRDLWGANWQIVYDGTGAGVLFDTGVPVVAGSLISLCMNYNHLTNTFKAYINGVLVDSRVVTMPNVTIHSNQFYLQKSAGTSSVSMYVDKMYIINKL